MDNEYKIVKITNISNFDFNGEKGARFGGKDFLIEAGKFLLVPFHVGEHLAKHLAHAIIISGAPVRTEKELAGKGSLAPLWDEARISSLMSQIMTDAYTEEKEIVKSADERMADRIKSLNETLNDDVEGNVSAADLKIDTSEKEGSIVVKDKAQVIEELKAKGMAFDPRASKASLEQLLK